MSGENSGKLTGDVERAACSSSLSSGILGMSGYSMSWGLASSFTRANVGMLLVLQETKLDICWNGNDVAATEIKWSSQNKRKQIQQHYNNTILQYRGKILRSRTIPSLDVSYTEDGETRILN